MISRRALLVGLVAGLGAAAGWLGLGVSARGRLGLRDPADVIRANFPTLAIDPAAIDAYLADWVDRRGPLGLSFRIRDELFTQFLLSSDFFVVRGSGGAAQPVRYVRWYDRWEGVCVHPFARFDGA